MSALSDTQQFLEQIQDKKVLVIGDVMIDQYLTGSVSRISPEAPVPILLHQETNHLPGGAANVAINLAGLGSEVWLASAIGSDEMGRKLIELLETRKIHTGLILASDQRLTTCKTRVMAGKQHLLRVDQERIETLQDQLRRQMTSSIRQLLEEEKIDIAILQDYNKGVLSAATIKEMLDLLHEFEVPVAVDPKVDNFYAYQGVALFKPNFAELRASLPFPVEITQESLAKAAEYLRSQLHCQTVMITLSDKGIFIDNGLTMYLLPTQKRLISDVCGAGDTVISVAALAWAQGFDLRSVAYWSGFCGTLVCQYPGVVPISSEILLHDDHYSPF